MDLKFNIYSLASIATLIAAAILLQILDGFMPLPIPGVKLGLANIVTLVMLFIYSSKVTACQVTMRVLLVSLLLGSFLGTAFFTSAAGAFMSFALMLLCKHCFYPAVSVVGISLVGAAAHLMAQITVISCLVGSPLIWHYFFWILPLAVLTGLLTGISAKLVLKHLSFLFDIKRTY